MSGPQTPETFFPKDFYCPITLELFQNPYIGPSNLTFEHAALVAHFNVSDKHPITRTPCSLTDFGPNISLRNAILSMQDEYKKRNIVVKTRLPTLEGKGVNCLTFVKAVTAESTDGVQTGVITIANEAEQPGSDVTVIIDSSGSMGASAALKNADGIKTENGMTLQDVTNASAVAILESLTDTDRISVIKYNANVTVVAPLAFATSGCKKTLSTKIKSINSGGQTNIWGALRTALEQYRNTPVTGRKQTIILLTDGRPNICPTRGEKHALGSWFSEYPDVDVDIHTVGFGNSIDSMLLYDIATVGRGTYNFLPSPDMIGTIFVNLTANCLSSGCEMPTVDIKLTTNHKFANEPVPGMTNQVTRISDNHIRVKCPRIKCNAPFSVAFELYPTNDKISADDITISGVPSLVEDRSESVVTNLDMHVARNIAIKGIDKINNFLRLGMSVDKVYMETLVALQKLPASQDTAAIIEDWMKQIREASNLSTHPNGQQFWQTWGQHWMRSLKMAHLYQYTNNFRDPGIQSYGKKCTLFEVLQDKITKIFDKLPPPEPSTYVKPENRCRSMSAYNNIAYDGCFDGDCEVLVQPNDPTQRPFPTKVRNLKKGDKVITSMHGVEFKTVDTVECLVRTRCTAEENGASYAEFCIFDNGLLITEWHPVLVGPFLDGTAVALKEWRFPADMKRPKTKKYCDYVYDVVLTNRSSTIMVNMIQVATLGHGLRGKVIGHDYFGDKIIDDLKNLNGYDNGLVTTNGFKRNADGGLIDGLID